MESRMETHQSRPYRSKRVKPCDACRVRKVGCVQSSRHGVCSLCQHRDIACTFLLKPAVRRKRQGGGQSPASSRTAAAAGTHAGGGGGGYSSSAAPGRGRGGPGPWQSTPSATPPESTGSGGGHFFKSEAASAVDVVQEHMDTRPQEILDQFYHSTHPSLPVLGPRRAFERDLARGAIPKYLSVVVTLHALHFDQSVMDLNGLSIVIRPWIHACLMEAAQTPTLRTLQCALLFMQLPSSCDDSHLRLRGDDSSAVVGGSTTPAMWALAAAVVAMAQNLGLHVEETEQQLRQRQRRRQQQQQRRRRKYQASLPASSMDVDDEREGREEEEEEDEDDYDDERGSPGFRRILWWAVFINEKWTSHLSGRPSHITPDGWWVSPPTLADFAVVPSPSSPSAYHSHHLPSPTSSSSPTATTKNGGSNFDDSEEELELFTCRASADNFIAMSILSALLSDVGDAFYAVGNPRRRYQTMELCDVISEAKRLVDRLYSWREQYYSLTPSDWSPPTMHDASEDGEEDDGVEGEGRGGGVNNNEEYDDYGFANTAHEYTKQLMSYAVCLKIHQAVYRAHVLASDAEGVGGLAEKLIGSLQCDLFRVLYSIRTKKSGGLWPSFIRDNLVIIAEALVDVAELPGIGPAVRRDRLALLREYEAHLEGLMVGHEEIRAGMCNFPHAAIEHLRRFFDGLPEGTEG